MWPGMISFLRVDDADQGPRELLVRIAHGLEEGAVRGPLHAFLDPVASHHFPPPVSLPHDGLAPIAMVPIIFSPALSEAMSAQRSPESRTADTASSIARASSSSLSECRRRSARREDRREGIGLVLARDVGRRTVYRLVEPGAAVAEARAREHADGAVTMLASSERMSPNMLLVAMTSNCRGVLDELHRRVVHVHEGEFDAGQVRARCADWRISRQSRTTRGCWPCRRRRAACSCRGRPRNRPRGAVRSRSGSSARYPRP